MNKRLLDNLLDEVSTYVPYYKPLSGAGIEEYPFITKSTIKNNYAAFLSDKLVDKDLILNCLTGTMEINNYIIEKCITPDIYLEWTTGSSGIPFKCIKTKKERNTISLNIWKKRMHIDKCITPTNFFPLIHTGQKVLPFDIRDYSHKNLNNLYSHIKNSNFTCIHTTPTLLRRHVVDSKVDQSIFRNTVEYIESTGSFLSQDEKELYERVFNAKVLNAYGLIELWSVAYTCKFGHMHVINDNVHFELIDEKQNVIREKNKVGQIAVTGLHQKTMPFIRYLTGDFGLYSDKECSCGEKGLIIELQQNRLINFLSTDSLRIDGNKYVKKMLRYVFWQHEFQDINYLCLMQDRNDFIFYMNPIDESKLFEILMSDSIKKELGENINIVFKYLTIEEFEKINPKNHLFINRSM